MVAALARRCSKALGQHPTGRVSFGKPDNTHFGTRVYYSFWNAASMLRLFAKYKCICVTSRCFYVFGDFCVACIAVFWLRGTAFSVGMPFSDIKRNMFLTSYSNKISTQWKFKSSFTAERKSFFVSGRNWPWNACLKTSKTTIFKISIDFAEKTAIFKFYGVLLV